MRLAYLIPLAALALCAATVAASRPSRGRAQPPGPAAHGHRPGGPVRTHSDDVPLVHYAASARSADAVPSLSSEWALR